MQPDEGVTRDLSWSEFARVDMRVGRIVAVDGFPEARRPAWKLTVDFGAEIGERRTSAQVTNYAAAELLGRAVIGVVNFPDKQIGPFMSQCLVLGTYTEERLVLLLDPAPGATPGDAVG